MYSRLKEARIKSGLTIDQISERLHVKKQYILALEEGNLNLLPKGIYTKAYLKLYADYLGIELELDPARLEDYLPPLEQTLSQNSHKQHRPIITVSLCLLMMVYVIYYLRQEPVINVASLILQAVDYNIN